MADYTLTPVGEDKGYSLSPVVAEGETPVAPPQPFLDRSARGEALNRVIAPYVAAAKGAVEGFGSEPLGLSPEHVQQLRDVGVYADPIQHQSGLQDGAQHPRAGQFDAFSDEKGR